MLKSYNVFATAAEKKSKHVENKQGTLLSWVNHALVTQPGVVEETIRKQFFGKFSANDIPNKFSISSKSTQTEIKDNNKRYCNKCSDLTCTKKYA